MSVFGTIFSPSLPPAPAAPERTFADLRCKHKAGLAGTVPLALLALLLANVAAAQPAPPTSPSPERRFETEVTLDEAVKRALERSPAAIAAEGEAQVARAARRSAWGAFLPAASADAGMSISGPTDVETNTGSTDSYSAGFAARWDVFTGLRRGATLRASGARIESAAAGLVEQRFVVALAVETAFFDVLRAEELLEVAVARLGRAQEGLTAAERRASVGSATQSDVLRSQLELNQARDSQLQYRTQRLSAAYSLGRLVGADGPVGAKREGAFTATPLAVSEKELLEELVSRTPSVRSAEAALIAAEAGLASARSSYAPSVGVSAGYDWFNRDFVADGWQPGWSARVGISIPIFDGFQREQGMVEARAALRTAKARLADERRRTRAELARIVEALSLAQQRVGLAEQAQQVAAEDLRVQQERYALGVTTILDLLASQESLVTAQSGLVEARFAYRLSRAELESVAGREL